MNAIALGMLIGLALIFGVPAVVLLAAVLARRADAKLEQVIKDVF